MKACIRNHCAAVGALLAANSAVLGVEGDKDSAIITCCRVDRPEILEMLLARCTRLHGKSALQAELMRIGAVIVASAWGHTACVKALLAHDVDVDAKSPSSDPILPNATALHLAVHHGHVQVITTLIEAGAAIDARDANHFTPLHIAVQKERALIVRLLRTLGADMVAVDVFGRLPVSYCQDGKIGAAIRAELVDPALDLLMLAARQGDEASCKSLSFAGLLGYLSVRQCVDVHSGDFWTPLMEAVVTGNMAFAHALARAGADVHRGDARGMSAVFWAHALLGRDAAETLAASAQALDSRSISKQCNVIKCKDGELRVSVEALMWMQDNFPEVAAKAVSCATLAVTLRAQGLNVITDGEVSSRHSESAPCTLLSEPESSALNRLTAAAQTSVGDALILEVTFQQQAHDVASGRCGAVEVHLAARRACMPDQGTANVHCQNGACEVVDFFRKLPTDHKIPGSQLAQARLAAIRLVASGSNLGLQQAFLLHVFTVDATLRNFTNAILHAGDATDVVAAFVSTLHSALQKLPTVARDTTVFRLIPGPFEPETYSEGNVLNWSGFTIGFPHVSALFSHDAAEVRGPAAGQSNASSQSLLLRIKAHTGRSLSEVSTGLGSNGVVFTPGTCFKVMGYFASDETALRLQDIRQSAHQSLDRCRVVVVDLQEVILLEDHDGF